MAEGAPDYRHLRVIQGKDALGNLVIVRVDDSGRIVMMPYGTMTVEGGVNVNNMPGDYLTEGGDVSVDQNAAERTMQGENGEGLHTILVDSLGRIIMVPYGFDGANYRVLKVDQEGRMISVMKGQADVTWELHGWWKFIASEALIVKDYSGYGNNLDAHNGGNGGADYVDGVIGQALRFNGIDTYVGLSAETSLSFASAMTVEVWLKITVEQTSRIIRMNGDAGTYGYYMLSLVAGAAMFEVYDKGAANQSQALGTSDLTDGEWHHIVGTTDRTHVKIYVDGVLEATVDDDTSDPLGVADFCIGASGGADEFATGLLDEVRVYDRCLSQDEVNWRYANTNPATGKPTRMVAVDNEGRMLVNVNDLPYKDTVMIFDYVNDHAAGTVKIEFDPVPDGKLWIITNTVCRCMLDVSGATSLYIRRGDDYYMIFELMRTATFDTLNFNGHAYLKAGDILACWFSAVDQDKSCQVYANGYSLNV